MKKIPTGYLKLILVVIMLIALLGFFYFENSLILRILSLLLAVISLWQINKIELAVLFTLYLSFNDLYNVHYWRAISIATIMIFVFLISLVAFYAWARIEKQDEALAKEKFTLYHAVTGLSVVEIFLCMDLWPVDPRVKSLLIVIVFFLFFRIIYLSGQNMLSLKRISGYLIITFLIFILAGFLTLRPAV